MAKAPPPVRESFTALSRPKKLDMEKGYAEGLRMLGPVSKNGGKYPTPVLNRERDKYEGQPCYVDMTGSIHHRDVLAGNDPPVLSKFGIWKNVVVVDGGYTGDLKFNPHHAFAPTFKWVCEECPEFYAFSPVHQPVKRYDADGTWTAESIRKVWSVDLVCHGGTTETVYESENRDMDTPADPRMIAVQFATPDALDTFLAALFDALPGGVFTPEAKAAVVQKLWDKYQPADVPADELVAAESLNRFGPLGRWAGGKIATAVTAERKKAKVEKARQVCGAKSVPAHLQTEPFLDVVAESLDNQGRLDALIADRIASGRPAGADDATRKDPYTTAGQPKKSLADLKAEAIAGL